MPLLHSSTLPCYPVPILRMDTICFTPRRWPHKRKCVLTNCYPLAAHEDTVQNRRFNAFAKSMFFRVALSREKMA